jgi:hypothetical protein
MLVTEEPLLDAAGRPRSPATMPGYHAGHPPRNKGIRYPADPPRVEEIVAVMRQAGAGIRTCQKCSWRAYLGAYLERRVANGGGAVSLARLLRRWPLRSLECLLGRHSRGRGRT